MTFFKGLWCAMTHPLTRVPHIDQYGVTAMWWCHRCEHGWLSR